MNIAPTLVKKLADNGIPYDIIKHRYSISSLNTAHVSNVPEDQLVKPVILEDQNGYIMALIPANKHVVVEELNMFLNRNMVLATEAEISKLFSDCDPGAIPPIGDAYGMETIVAYDFDECPDVYLEAGNHTDVLHLTGKSFHKLMGKARHADICVH